MKDYKRGNYVTKGNFKKRTLSAYIILGLILVLGLATVLLTSCTSITSAVIGGAESGLTRALSERVEQSVYKKMAPKEQLPPPKTPGWNTYMTSQAYVMFSYAFTPGGYWIGTENYKPGEWTKFKVVMENGDEIILEKAFLKKLDNGNEWWRVSWTTGEEEWIYEALIDPKDGKILRMRARDADGNEGELPVSGDSSVYRGGEKLTKESLEGATVGIEKIKTPAGTFKARHIQFMAMGGGKIDWWMVDSVPGQVVKYVLTGEDKTRLWSAVLIDYGKGAKTKLGVY